MVFVICIGAARNLSTIRNRRDRSASAKRGDRRSAEDDEISHGGRRVEGTGGGFVAKIVSARGRRRPPRAETTFEGKLRGVLSTRRPSTRKLSFRFKCTRCARFELSPASGGPFVRANSWESEAAFFAPPFRARFQLLETPRTASALGYSDIGFSLIDRSQLRAFRREKKSPMPISSNRL